MTLEIRAISNEDAKAKVEDEGKTLSGYATVWNQRSRPLRAADLGEFVETLKPDCFNRSLESRDIFFCIEHNENDRVGRTRRGTLELTPDDYGLHFRLRLPETQRTRDMVALIDAGEYDGMSIGFKLNKRSVQREGKYPLQVVEDGDLVHISLARNPAYTATMVSVRDLEGTQPPTKPPVKLLELYHI